MTPNQRRAINHVNNTMQKSFRLLQGIEANIGVQGQLDLSSDEAATFDLVLAAPHSRLRKDDDQTAQTARLIVAIEIDGDPARQDLDHTLARQALTANCLFALDSDAHTTTQLSYAETALAHARLASIPAERIVNCWPLDRLLAWLAEPSHERRP